MSKRKKKIVPDEVMESDLLRASRYWNDVIMENLQNQERYKRFMEQQAERYPIVCQEINDVVSEIAKIVVKYKPLPLLNRAYRDMIVAHINTKTESNISMEWSHAHEWLIYLQNIIASNPPHNDQAEDIREEDYIHLSKLSAIMYIKTHIEYHICYFAKQKKNIAFNKDTAEIEVIIRMCYNGVSGRQHPYFQSEVLYKLLSPHDAIIKKLFGINAQDFIEGIKKIQTSLTIGMGDACGEYGKILMTHHTGNEVSLTSLTEVLSKQELQPQLNEVWGKISGYGLFDLQKVTNLPAKLLEALSLSAGEDKEFMDKDEPYAGWALKRYPSRFKPFLKVDGRYYCFHEHNLADHIYRALEKAILNAEPSYKDKWQIKQGEIGEEYTFELFAKLLPGAEIYRNVKYKWHPNRNKSKKGTCEADGIIIFDDNLFIVEVKSGAFSPHSPITDSEGFPKSMKNLLEKPYTQGQRLYEYLKEHENGAPLSDRDGDHLIDIRLSDYRRITICCVTLEQLADFGGQLNELKKIGIDIDIEEHPVWAISIDDLRVYADLIQSPSVFCHYLEKRNDTLTKLRNFKITSELDHYGAYLQYNNYVEYFYADQELDLIQPNAFRGAIDIYYNELLIEKQPSPPSKNTTPIIKQIIEIADSQQMPGRCRLVSDLLNLTAKEQDEFSNFIADDLIRKRQNNPQIQTKGKTGRNEPCPCGSGKKYKKCHGH